MKKELKFLLLILLLGANIQMVAAQGKSSSLIVLVRHAEKGTGQNPPLSDEGKARAERLALLLKDIHFDTIYSTDYIRTRSTVEPLLREGQQLFLYNYEKQEELAKRLRGTTAGKALLVAGHSNTIPFLANSLIEKNEYEELNEAEFGKLWMIVVKDGKAVDWRVINY